MTLLLIATLIGVGSPSVSANVTVTDPNPPDGGGQGGSGGGGGGGSAVPFTDISCSNIYLDWWEDVGSDAKGMWNSAPGWSGCIAVRAQGVLISGDYMVKVPYLTTTSNSTKRSGRKDVVLVHGSEFDGDGWQPMCKYLLKKYSNNLYRCFAPSLTGMGGSGYPNANFDSWTHNQTEMGDLKEIEFAGALDAALAGIKAKDGLKVGEWIVGGFSNGGVTVQMLQDRLRDEGTQLRDKYGIDKVVMMAPSLPHEVCWQFADDTDRFDENADYPFTVDCDNNEDEGMLWTLIDTFAHQAQYDWDAGTFADPAPNYGNDEWVETWWSEKGEDNDISTSYDPIRNGRLPTTTEAYYVSNWMGWDSFNEMVGNNALAYDRPSVAADIWGGTETMCYDRDSAGTPCTRFVSVSFDKDRYIWAEDVQNLHRYLTTSWPTCLPADGAYHDCTVVTGTHGAIFSLYASAWDRYVSSGYNISKLTTQMDPMWDKLVVS